MKQFVNLNIINFCMMFSTLFISLAFAFEGYILPAILFCLLSGISFLVFQETLVMMKEAKKLEGKK